MHKIANIVSTSQIRDTELKNFDNFIVTQDPADGSMHYIFVSLQNEYARPIFINHGYQSAAVVKVTAFVEGLNNCGVSATHLLNERGVISFTLMCDPSN